MAREEPRSEEKERLVPLGRGAIGRIPNNRLTLIRRRRLNMHCPDLRWRYLRIPPPCPCTINSLYLFLKQFRILLPFFRYPLTTSSLAFNPVICSSMPSLLENLVAMARLA